MALRGTDPWSYITEFPLVYEIKRVGSRPLQGRRHYAPPKSFLDFISLFISIYGERSAHFAEMRRRLSNGLAKLHAASRQV